MNASATCTGAAPDASEANLAAAVTPPTSSALDVSSRDNKGWSLYGAPWLQPVAIGGKSGSAESRRNKPNALPWVATACFSQRMVRRGSTGSSPSEGSAKSPLTVIFRSEGLADDPACAGYGAVHGALRLAIDLL